MKTNGKRFGLIGAAGYIAPRHMEAIKLNEGQLVAALDPNDSVGQMDKYFQDALFFNNFERFERYINLLNSQNQTLDFMSICSPNYLHDTHCRFALLNQMHAICEKPLVLNPWNLDQLQRTESETGRHIYNILQLRLHPEIVKLKKYVEDQGNKHFEVQLNYITSRGPWYQISWKGRSEMSGGIATNIGIHFFDMLMWIFGKCEKQEVYSLEKDYAAGTLFLESATVDWFLSVDPRHLELVESRDKRTYRSLEIDGRDYEFSQGFEDLHVSSYEHILHGKGFSSEEVRPAIQLVHDIRNSKITNLPKRNHKLLSQLKY